MTIFAATCAFFSDGISSMILCGIKLLMVFSAFIDANLAIFRDMANPRVAPVVLPGSRQHHFRSTALETSTSASYRRSLTAPQTLEVGPPDLRPFSPTPRDCSAAAPHTARQSNKFACPAIYTKPEPRVKEDSGHTTSGITNGTMPNWPY